MTYLRPSLIGPLQPLPDAPEHADFDARVDAFIHAQRTPTNCESNALPVLQNAHAHGFLNHCPSCGAPAK